MNPLITPDAAEAVTLAHLPVLGTEEIPLEEARHRNPEAEIGDFMSEPLPPIDFGRVAAMAAKQVITQKVREAERDRQYEDFKDRIGEVINGIIKRVEYGHVIVDLGKAEAIVRRQTGAFAIEVAENDETVLLMDIPAALG